MPNVDLSRERRRLAIRTVRGDGVLHAGLSENAQLTYVVGILVATNIGVVKMAELQSAMNDPSVLNAARQILATAAKRGD